MRDAARQTCVVVTSPQDRRTCTLPQQVQDQADSGKAWEHTLRGMPGRLEGEFCRLGGKCFRNETICCKIATTMPARPQVQQMSVGDCMQCKYYSIDCFRSPGARESAYGRYFRLCTVLVPITSTSLKRDGLLMVVVVGIDQSASTILLAPTTNRNSACSCGARGTPEPETTIFRPCPCTKCYTTVISDSARRWFGM